MNVVRLREGAFLPLKKYKDDAGFDLFSTERTLIKPGAWYQFKLGIAVEIPKGYVGLVQGRSGLAVTHGVDTIGNVIDSGYTGEISATIVNNSEQDLSIVEGNRIAQLILLPIYQKEVREVAALAPSDRNSNGYGSSGK